MTSITQATLEHIDSLTVAFEAYRKFYRKDADKDGAKTFLKNRITKKESIIFVALSDKNEVIGFTQLYPSFSSTRLKRAWILNDLFVHEHSRGLGVSKLLINKAQDLTRDTKACVLMLETEKNNSIGNKLYVSTGFELETNNFYYWIP